MITGKKILISQYSLRLFAGSEIVTLELAIFLKKYNNEVIVFTWFLDDPIKTFAEQNQITIITDDNDPRLSDFDFIWVHHQVLPQSIIKNIASKKSFQPKIIFYHMSALENILLEQPYIYDLENRLSSLTMFVSDESQKSLIDFYPSLSNNTRFILPNWSPDEYLIDTKQHKSPHNIAIISNHIPEEIHEATDILKYQGLSVTFFGLNHKVEKVTPQLLKNFDIVITIGKTVQYCLTMGLPVYVYDHFGGPGYLNDNNFKQALNYNFSGRSFTKKSADKIAKEIIDQYDQAILYYKKNQSKFQKQFSMTNLLEEVFSRVSDRASKTWTDEYRRYVAGAEDFAAKSIKFTVTSESFSDITTKFLDAQKKLHNVQQELGETQNNLQRIESSRLVKTVRKIKAIPNKLKALIDRPEIIAALCIYNEECNLELFLKHIERYVDKIIILDDGSSDNSVNIAKKHPKVVAIEYTNNKHIDNSYNEKENREKLVRMVKNFSSKSSSYVMCIDPDERLESKLLKNLRRIASKYRKEKVVLYVKFKELWNDPSTWRSDGIWGKKTRPLMFQVADKMTYSFPHQYHAPWAYDEIKDNIKILDYSVYHLHMIKYADRQKRKELYKSFDPHSKIQKIGYDYLTDESDIRLEKIPKNEAYDLTSVPNYYK